MKNAVVIVAGGMGTRLGKNMPKAYVPLGGQELFTHSLQTFDTMGIFSEAVIVVPGGYEEETLLICERLGISLPVKTVPGGAERWQSVANGANAADAELLFIHDAARPFVTTEVVENLISQRGDAEGIITANPVVDTVRKFQGDTCGETVDRSTLIAVGTPQVFLKSSLLYCYDHIKELDAIPTDEAMLLEKFDKPVKFAYGTPLNFKVTTPSDFTIAEALLKARGKSEA